MNKINTEWHGFTLEVILQVLMKCFLCTTFLSLGNEVKSLSENKLRKRKRNQIITHFDIYRSTRLSHWQSVCSCTWALHSGFCTCVRLSRTLLPGDAHSRTNNLVRIHILAAHSGFCTFSLLGTLRYRKFLKYENQNLIWITIVKYSIPELKSTLLYIKGFILVNRSKVESESCRFVLWYSVLYHHSPINLCSISL